MFVSKKKWIELETKVKILLEERNAEIKELREEVKKFTEVKELLKPIKLKVKKALFRAIHGQSYAAAWKIWLPRLLPDRGIRRLQGSGACFGTIC